MNHGKYLKYGLALAAGAGVAALFGAPAYFLLLLICPVMMFVMMAMMMGGGETADSTKTQSASTRTPDVTTHRSPRSE